MTKPRRNAWPWPADTQLDRARRVAQSYRAELLARLPDVCAALDAAMLERGQRWVVPRPAVADLDEWVTVSVAAEHVGLTDQAVYAWVYRRKLRSKTLDGRVVVPLAEALEVKAGQRRERVRRHLT